MPNYCNYTLKVKGDIENCKKFKAKLDDYDEENHFWRIFESDISEEGSDYLVIYGYCAWSIESCCRESGYSNGIDLFAVNTADLNLDLEVWSEERDGCFFDEHYVYRKGDCITDECNDVGIIAPFYWDKETYPTFETLCEQYNIDKTKITEDNYDEDGEWMGEESDLFVGGFENWGTFEI